MLFGYIINRLDFDGLKDGQWVTGAVLNALFLYMAECYSEASGSEAAVSVSAAFTQADVIHVIADNVMLVTTDFFSNYNPVARREDGEEPYTRVCRLVGSIFQQVLTKGGGEGTKVLIPYAYNNMHWYLMCIIISSSPKLVVMDSCPAQADNKQFTQLLVQCINDCMQLFDFKDTYECETIYHKGLKQKDGYNCGIFTAYSVSCLQSEPHVLDDITSDGKISNANSILGTRFNTNRFRMMLKWLILHLVYKRAPLEEADARRLRRSDVEFDVDAVYEGRAEAIRQYMERQDIMCLIEGLQEYEQNPFGISEIGNDIDPTPAFARTQFFYYQLGGAPYITQFYAGCVPIKTSSHKKFFFRDLFKIDEEEHDNHHGFVQTVFATDQQSGVEPGAKLLTPADVEIIGYSPVLSERHRWCLNKLLFMAIGLEFDWNLDRAPLKVKNQRLFTKTILKNTHYRPRVSRWLLHLRLFGYEAQARSFYMFLMEFVHNKQMMDFTAQNDQCWKEAITCQLWR
jgi:hypothetical protein